MLKRRDCLPASLLAPALTLVWALAACAPAVETTRTDPAIVLRGQTATRLTGSSFSVWTRAALADGGLAEEHADDAFAAIDALRALADREPDGDWRIAAAELLYDQAERSNPRDVSLDLAAARDAEAELARALAGGRGLLDARTEFASDLLNRAVAAAIDQLQGAWPDLPSEISGAGGSYQLVVPPPGKEPRLDPGRFDTLLPADSLRVRGMASAQRTDAYGSALVAIREQEDADPPRSDPFVPPEGEIIPVTATITFGGPDRSLAKLHLWDIDRVTSIERFGQKLLLSTDTTAPIAELFARTELAREAADGLINTEKYLRRIGIYTHEPYSPDKIPVLMVHGLRSSPITWRDMLNGLRDDPEIRANYQFWMFLYPSGLPIPRSAAYLREHLALARAHFDPDNTDRGMDDMLLIGHSMGGLVSKAVLQDSGDALWHSLHPEPFEEIEAPDEVRGHLQEVFFYDADPDIDRVIFIATPHRGSAIASGFFGRLGDSFVKLPQEFREIRQWVRDEVRALNDDNATGRQADAAVQLMRGVPSSIDDLRPDSPHLNAYLETPVRDGVTAHTILGNGAGDSDGVVPVTSASVDFAASELTVDAHHDAHTHPLAIREVRRILLEHLRATGRAD